MRNDEHLYQEYPDLLDGDPDASLLHLVGEMDSISSVITSPQYVTNATVRALKVRANETPHRGWGLRLDPSRRLPHRLSTAMAVMLVALALGGAGYAAWTVLEQAFYQPSLGTEHILEQSLGTKLSMSQSLDGFTVTVRRVYADPNQIVIAYTLAGPPGRTFNHIHAWGEYDETPGMRVASSPVLTDDQGRKFQGGGAPVQSGVEDGVTAGLLLYDGAGIRNNPKELKVRLKIGELSAYEALGEDRFRDVTVNGPFLFDLMIPVDPGRAAEVHQTVESGGAKATLERAVTSATGTRVLLRGVGPNAQVIVRVGDVGMPLNPMPGLAQPTQWSPDSQWEYISSGSLMDQHGEWTVVVQPGAAVPPHVDPNATKVEGGPWTFRFQVP